MRAVRAVRAVRAAASPPAQHALANQQDHCVVRAPEFQATGSKDVLACANRFFHLTKLIQILFMVKFGGLGKYYVGPVGPGGAVGAVSQ